MLVLTCDCGAKMISLRLWNSLPKAKRAEHKANGVQPHTGRGRCRPCYGRANYTPRPRAVAPNCSDCGCKTVPKSQWVKATREQREALLEQGTRPHFGRGKCSACYKRANRRGLIVGEDVSGEARRLKQIGLTLKQIASELDITVAKARRLTA